jgi:hypothetical protein
MSKYSSPGGDCAALLSLLDRTPIPLVALNPERDTLVQDMAP